MEGYGEDERGKWTSQLRRALRRMNQMVIHRATGLGVLAGLAELGSAQADAAHSAPTAAVVWACADLAASTQLRLEHKPFAHTLLAAEAQVKRTLSTHHPSESQEDEEESGQGTRICSLWTGVRSVHPDRCAEVTQSFRAFARASVAMLRGVLAQDSPDLGSVLSLIEWWNPFQEGCLEEMACSGYLRHMPARQPL